MVVPEEGHFVAKAQPGEFADPFEPVLCFPMVVIPVVLMTDRRRCTSRRRHAVFPIRFAGYRLYAGAQNHLVDELSRLAPDDSGYVGRSSQIRCAAKEMRSAASIKGPLVFVEPRRGAERHGRRRRYRRSQLPISCSGSFSGNHYNIGQSRQKLYHRTVAIILWNCHKRT